MRYAVPFACSVLAVTACSSPTPLSLDITAGQETSAFDATPKVTRVDVTMTSLDGTVNVKASAAPGNSFDLGNVASDQQISVEAVGFTADGTAVMHGLSLGGLTPSSITGGLPVFMQRTNQWARPPGGLSMSHVGGVAGAIGERYVVLTGGAKATGDTSKTAVTQVDGYDLLVLDGAVFNPFPRAPATIVTLTGAIVVIDAMGATWVDFQADTITDLALPAGLASFGDVAGGATVYASNGRTFVVGATRSSPATKAVLQVNDDGTLAAYSLVTARQGAAAAYVDTIGLVVAGGSATGAGIELLADDGTGTAKAFLARGYPKDAVEGAGAVSDGSRGVALIGGTVGGMAADTRLLDDVTCLADCTVKPVAAATLPVAMTSVVAYGLGSGNNIVVGDESGGMGLTRTFLVGLGGSVKEVPLREPRRGATSMPTPLGTLSLLGGEHPDGTPALSIEQFFPQ